MFELEKNLRNIILENLPEDGMSISALSRQLRERGIKVHRLELSGYLKAMADMQLLRERDIKPSKVFVPMPEARKSIYEFLGDIVKREEEDENSQSSMALYVLCRLFRRPIFERELRMCGLIGIPKCRSVDDREIAQTRKIALRIGMKLSPGDRALMSEEDYSESYGKILAELLIDMCGLRAYTSETKQKTLEEG